MTHAHLMKLFSARNSLTMEELKRVNKSLEARQDLHDRGRDAYSQCLFSTTTNVCIYFARAQQHLGREE